MLSPTCSRLTFRAGAALAVMTVLSAAALIPAQPATAAQFNPQEQQIVNELPVGFGPSSCTTATDPPPVPDALATVDHRGTVCPGADGSPSSWNYTATPDQVEGQILCGTFQNSADVEWTRNSQSLLIDALGNSDVNSLYTWWAHYGNPKSGPGPTPNTAATLGHI